MTRFKFGRSSRWKHVFLGAAAALSVLCAGYEGVLAAESGVSAEAFISEEAAAAQEQAVEKKQAEEALKESRAGGEVRAFASAVRSFSGDSREKAGELAELENTYEAFSEEEKGWISEDTLSLFSEAKSRMAALNHSHNGVTVTGNLPWYVQFSAERRPDEGKVNDSTWIVVPYNMELTDLKTGEAYTLPEGESVTVTMPVPETLLRGQFVIYHYKSDGSVENIVPKIEGSTMSFQTTSFSPYEVAGSSVVAGIGITTEFYYPEESEDGSETEGGTETGAENVETENSGTDTGGNSQTGSLGQAQVSPAPTGDDTNVRGLLLSAFAAFLVMAGNMVMKKRHSF